MSYGKKISARIDKYRQRGFLIENFTGYTTKCGCLYNNTYLSYCDHRTVIGGECMHEQQRLRNTRLMSRSQYLKEGHISQRCYDCYCDSMMNVLNYGDSLVNEYTNMYSEFWKFYWQLPSVIEWLKTELENGTRQWHLDALRLSEVYTRQTIEVAMVSHLQVIMRTFQSKLEHIAKSVQKLLKLFDQNRNDTDTLVNRTCMTCEGVIDIVIIPCGHIICCKTCSKHLNRQCPLCRGLIEKTVKIF